MEQIQTNDRRMRRSYEVPGLTVVTFKTERGFAGSGDRTLGLFSSAGGDNALEERQSSSATWAGSTF